MSDPSDLDLEPADSDKYAAGEILSVLARLGEVVNAYAEKLTLAERKSIGAGEEAMRSAIRRLSAQ
jgi:hypothetical protein